jgi:hypothetical protein
MVIDVMDFKKASIAITRGVDSSTGWFISGWSTVLIAMRLVSKPFHAGIATISPVM